MGLLLRLRTPVVLAMVSRGRFKAAFLLRGYVAWSALFQPATMRDCTSLKVTGEEEGFGSSARRQPGFVSRSGTELRKSGDLTLLAHFFTFITCFLSFRFPFFVFRRPLLSHSHSQLLCRPPLHQHELARVSFIHSDVVILPQFHLRFKKSMNRAGTTVRMEPLVFPIC